MQLLYVGLSKLISETFTIRVCYHLFENTQYTYNSSHCNDNNYANNVGNRYLCHGDFNSAKFIDAKAHAILFYHQKIA